MSVLTSRANDDVSRTRTSQPQIAGDDFLVLTISFAHCTTFQASYKEINSYSFTLVYMVDRWIGTGAYVAQKSFVNNS